MALIGTAESSPNWLRAVAFIAIPAVAFTALLTFLFSRLEGINLKNKKFRALCADWRVKHANFVSWTEGHPRPLGRRSDEDPAWVNDLLDRFPLNPISGSSVNRAKIVVPWLVYAKIDGVGVVVLRTANTASTVNVNAPINLNSMKYTQYAWYVILDASSASGRLAITQKRRRFPGFRTLEFWRFRTGYGAFDRAVDLGISDNEFARTVLSAQFIEAYSREPLAKFIPFAIDAGTICCCVLANHPEYSSDPVPDMDVLEPIADFLRTMHRALPPATWTR